MTKRELKRFLKRRDVKLSGVMFIIGIEVLAYIDKNWKFIFLFSLGIIIAFLAYLCIKEEIKEYKR